MDETGNQPPDKEQEARRERERDLNRAYKRFLSTVDGRMILEDMAAKFGHEKSPYVYGCTDKDLAFRCGQQEPLRYMHKMASKVLRPLGETPKKVLAKSAPPTS